MGIPSRDPARTRALLATEMTSGPIPSPGRRVMEYRLVGAVAEQRIVTHFGACFERDLDGSCCCKPKGLPLNRSDAAMIKGLRSRLSRRSEED